MLRNMGGWGVLGLNANPDYPREGRGSALGGGGRCGFWGGWSTWDKGH
jgi:hypothetical protein